jgi:two-component system OmpR family response regulator
MGLRTNRLLLLIENPDLGGILKLALNQYDLELFSRGGPAGDAVRRQSFELAIVDLSLGGRPAGLNLIRDWRASGAGFPIIAISDIPQPSLAVEALDAGADDYLRKPFHHEELLVRIRKLLRRGENESAMRKAGGVVLGHEAFVFGGATVLPSLLVRFPLGEEERIRPKQHGILKYFTERAGGLVLKEELVKAVWGSDANDAGHSVNEYVSMLRRLFIKHRIDFNRLVVSEPKAGWRIHAEAAQGRADSEP